VPEYWLVTKAEDMPQHSTGVKPTLALVAVLTLLVLIYVVLATEGERTPAANVTPGIVATNTPATR
jgi:hypothetical protein